MNLADPDYCQAWAENAISKARQYQKLGNNYWTGIFADSICWGWWWPNSTLANTYGDKPTYLSAQEQLCEIVGEYARKRGFKFGANIGIGTPGYAAWPEIFEHLDLAFFEHTKLGAPIDPVIVDPNRKFRLAIHIEYDPKVSLSYNVQMAALKDINLVCSIDHITIWLVPL